MKVGDIGVDLTFIAHDENNIVMDLSLVDTVTLVLYLGGNRVSRMCTFGDKTKGEIKYTTQSGDLLTSGSLEMEIKLTFLDGDTITCMTMRDEIEPVL